MTRKSKNDIFKGIINDLAKEDNIKDIQFYKIIYDKFYNLCLNKAGEIIFEFKQLDIINILTELNDEDININNIVIHLDKITKEQNHYYNKKLIDYINSLKDMIKIEVVRINYINANIEERINITGENFSNTAKELSKEFKNLKFKQREISRAINNAYSDLISILGLFSGIVLVFFGGSKIFGDVITSIQELDFEKAILFCTIVGLILFNIIFMFIYYIAKLLERDISASDDSSRWIRIFNRFKIRYPLIYYFNIVLIVIMLVSFFVMICRRILIIDIYGTRLSSLIKEFIINMFIQDMKFSILISVFIIFNLLFFCAYIYAKITDVNIGCIIKLKYGYVYDWRYNYDEEEYSIYKNDKFIKIVDDFEQAEKYVNGKNQKFIFMAKIINLFKRVFFRYPYMALINITILYLLLNN